MIRKNPRKKYTRWSLNIKQADYLNMVYDDKLFLKVLNKIYYNTLKSTVERGSYSSSDVTRRTLKRICEEYVTFTTLIDG